MWFFRASNTRTTMMTGQQPEKQISNTAHLNLLLAHQKLHFLVVISHFLLPKPPQVFLPLKAHQFLLANLLLFAQAPAASVSFGPVSALSSCFNFSTFHFLHPSPQLCSRPRAGPGSPAGCLCPETLMQFPHQHTEPSRSQHSCV